MFKKNWFSTNTVSKQPRKERGTELKIIAHPCRVGIELPTVEVQFERLTVQAQCQVGSRALPTLLNTARNIAEGALGLLGMRLGRQATLTILKDVFGTVRPSRMTLLLGPPSSGKTTLLLALAGKLDPSLRCNGEVAYNGYSLDKFVPQKTAAYISQTDVHVGVMTVKEHLNSQPGARASAPNTIS
ncbi:ABC transporter G family member 42-like [Triticum aestivum]|uniref:ABC transporter G family member 42-like n=1 Tax=Triticum aestivum TaxID=4565 RepID=UPI001D02A480|nr:ABC transporter G family member 42-like [Triticum aestivum]